MHWQWLASLNLFDSILSLAIPDAQFASYCIHPLLFLSFFLSLAATHIPLRTIITKQNLTLSSLPPATYIAHAHFHGRENTELILAQVPQRIDVELHSSGLISIQMGIPLRKT